MDGVVISAPPLYTTLPAANKVLASPDGAPGRPTARSLVTNDLGSGSTLHDGEMILFDNMTWGYQPVYFDMSYGLKSPFVQLAGNFGALYMNNDMDLYITSDATPVSTIYFHLAGHDYGGYGPTGMFVTTRGGWGFASGLYSNTTVDTFMYRGPSAGIIEQRNLTAAQTLKVFNTYTDSSNGEWGTFGWSGNVLTLGTAKNGTGTARAMVLQTGGVTALTLGTDQSGIFAGTLQTGGALSVITSATAVYDLNAITWAGQPTLTRNGGTGTVTLQSTAGSLILASSGVTALTLGTNQNATFAGYALGLNGTPNSYGSAFGVLTINSSNGSLIDFNIAGAVGAEVAYVGGGTKRLTLGTVVAGGSVQITTAAGAAALTIDASQNATLVGTLTVSGTGASSFAGQVKVPDGSLGAPSIAIGNNGGGTYGIYYASGWRFSDGGVYRFGLVSSGVLDVPGNTLSALTLGHATSYVSMGGDVFVYRGGAGILQLRNSTNAQELQVYNTYTDSSNYERGFVRWSSNVFELGTLSAGTGTSRGVRITAFGDQLYFNIGGGGGDKWQVTNGGHFIATTDKANDIGASGANRPRYIYPGSALVLPNTTVANLPAASTAGSGALAFVTDSANTAITGLGLAVVGGGANKVPVYSDGTNWIVM